MFCWSLQENDVTWEQRRTQSQFPCAPRISLPRKQRKRCSRLQPGEPSVHDTFTTCNDSFSVSSAIATSSVTCVTGLYKSDTRYWIVISRFNVQNTRYGIYIIITTTQTCDSSAKLNTLEAMVDAWTWTLQSVFQDLTLIWKWLYNPVFTALGCYESYIFLYWIESNM